MDRYRNAVLFTISHRAVSLPRSDLSVFGKTRLSSTLSVLDTVVFSSDLSVAQRIKIGNELSVAEHLNLGSTVGFCQGLQDIPRPLPYDGDTYRRR